MRATIPIEHGRQRKAADGIRRLLERLLEAEIVDALLVPMETPTGAITPALVSDPDLLSAARPLAPVMGLNAARIAGKVSIREPRGRIGVVLRPCELRALVELVKLQQASPDDLVTIGIDCCGTYDVPTYLAKAQKKAPKKGGRGAGPQLWAQLFDRLSDNPAAAPPDLRDACQMCERPHVEQADITVELFGADLNAGIPVTLPDEMGERLGLEPTEMAGQRDETIEKIVAARTEARDARFTAMRQRLDEEGIEQVLSECVRCHNCMTVCPICYCKTCLFKSAALDHTPRQYADWARRKGVYRLPADTMLFHLTRLNHMVLSCVGCGMCTDGCPAGLPVGQVFRTIGQQVQAKFDYTPGHSVQDGLPIITFREDEWLEKGEE
ncbi:MAG TPA: (Fe-S)-binding protein [Chloroflexi bacterium]|nr:(Fe-S)-binding protein [Chloroflexota bacterium]